MEGIPSFEQEEVLEVRRDLVSRLSELVSLCLTSRASLATAHPPYCPIYCPIRCKPLHLLLPKALLCPLERPVCEGQRFYILNFFIRTCPLPPAVSGTLTASKPCCPGGEVGALSSHPQIPLVSLLSLPPPKAPLLYPPQCSHLPAS